MIKVGDSLYQLNSWHNANRPKWKPDRITGETKQSWLLGDTKVNKGTMTTAKDRRGHNKHYFTYEGMVARDFCDQWSRDVGSAVSVCDDPEKLKQIAAIVGKELT